MTNIHKQLAGSLTVVVFAFSVVSLAAGQQTIRPAYASVAHHDVSFPLLLMHSSQSVHSDHALQLQVNFTNLALSKPKAADRAVQTYSTVTTVTAKLSFNGIASNGWIVPDANGAAGATQYVQWVNDRFAVFSKANGALLYGPVAGNSLWSGFGGPCQSTNSGDPIAQYDKLAERWIMTQHASPSGGKYYQCVAVSVTSDATGRYYRYAFQLPNYYPDYPKLGVWADAYYLSTNLENQNKQFAFINALICALDRKAMLTGASAAAVCFQVPTRYSSLLPADLDGSTLPPAGSPEYLVNLDTNSIDLWQLHVDFVNTANSTFRGPTNIPVASFGEACNGGVCVPQRGTSQKLDSLGDRLMYRLAYRNFGTHESMVVTHSVNPPTNAWAGIRWYEIRDPGTAPAIYQQGTYSPNAASRWMGSIAMDKLGNIAVGYSVSSAYIHPGIRVAGRVPSDPLGTLESEVSIFTGNGSQTGSNRWGDYTSMSVDPVDDCTFWYTNEYVPSNGNRNWHTRISSFKFSSCQ